MLLLLNGKRGGDAHLKEKRVNEKVVPLKDVFWIVPPYWPTFHLPGTVIGVSTEDYIGKSRGYGASIAGGEREVDNLSTYISIANANRKIDDIGIDTSDGIKKGENPGTSTSTDIIDGKTDNSCIEITNVDGTDNKGIDKDGRRDR